MPKYYWVMSFSLSYVYDYQVHKVRQVVTFMSLLQIEDKVLRSYTSGDFSCFEGV